MSDFEYGVLAPENETGSLWHLYGERTGVLDLDEHFEGSEKDALARVESKGWQVVGDDDSPESSRFKQHRLMREILLA